MINYEELDRMIDEAWTIDADLKELGITREEALRRADEYIAEVKALYKKYDIKEQHKVLMIEDICEMADPDNPEHLKLICDFAADYGLLFNDISDDYKLAAWMRDAPLAHAIYKLVTTRKEKSRIMQDLAKCRKTDTNSGISHFLEVFNLLAENGYADGVPDISILKDNLADVERIINTYEGFVGIAPFVYYQALVRNSKKMLEKHDYSLNPESIFKYQKYSIDADNGKNFDTYTDYLQLYIDLLNIFSEADKELCEVCYLSTSNLGKWNYDNADAEDVPMFIDDKLGIAAYYAFDSGLTEFKFFQKNDVEYSDVEVYEQKHPQLWKTIKKKLDAVTGRKLHYILENDESIVKELSLEMPVKPDDLLVFQACCYMMIADYVSDCCVEMFRSFFRCKNAY